MTRATSTAAYRSLVEDGALPEARRFVYGIVCELSDRARPPTSAEVDEMVKRLGGRRLQHTRLTELCRMQILEEGPERACTVTKQAAITWVPTGTTGIPLVKKKRVREPSADVLELVAEELEDHCQYVIASEDDVDAVLAWLGSRIAAQRKA